MASNERVDGWQRCSWGSEQREHGRDVQGEQQRYGDCRDQREREFADRFTGRRDVEQLVSGEGAEGQGNDQIGDAERVELPRRPVRAGIAVIPALAIAHR